MLEQLAEEAVLEKPQRAPLDPEALLREAEEGVENLDEVCGSMLGGLVAWHEVALLSTAVPACGEMNKVPV